MEISNPNFQIMASHSLEEVVLGDQCSKTYQQNEKKPRPDPETALKCPRCESTNTKFCYYNNYSLSQPRYFCKGCRRYWTKGGSLRNVPVGGGCRKNKKSSKRTQDHQPLTTNLNTTQLLPTLPPPPSFSHNHHHHPNDHLTLNFDTLLHNPNPSPNPNTGFLDILRSGFLENNNSTITPTSLQNLYHGFDGGFMSSNSNQESCKAMEGEENKVLMGLQWQLGVDSDSGRDHNCWNGGGVGSPWHGLINSSFIG